MDRRVAREEEGVIEERRTERAHDRRDDARPQPVLTRKRTRTRTNREPQSNIHIIIIIIIIKNYTHCLKLNTSRP